MDAGRANQSAFNLPEEFFSGESVTQNDAKGLLPPDEMSGQALSEILAGREGDGELYNSGLLSKEMSKTNHNMMQLFVHHLLQSTICPTKLF